MLAGTERKESTKREQRTAITVGNGNDSAPSHKTTRRDAQAVNRFGRANSALAFKAERRILN